MGRTVRSGGGAPCIPRFVITARKKHSARPTHETSARFSSDTPFACRKSLFLSEVTLSAVPPLPAALFGAVARPSDRRVHAAAPPAMPPTRLACRGSTTLPRSLSKKQSVRATLAVPICEMNACPLVRILCNPVAACQCYLYLSSRPVSDREDDGPRALAALVIFTTLQPQTRIGCAPACPVTSLSLSCTVFAVPGLRGVPRGRRSHLLRRLPGSLPSGVYRAVRRSRGGLVLRGVRHSQGQEEWEWGSTPKNSMAGFIEFRRDGGACRRADPDEREERGRRLGQEQAGSPYDGHRIGRFRGGCRVVEKTPLGFRGQA